MIRCKLVEQVHPDATDAVARVDRAVTGEILGLGRAASCKVYLPDPRVRLEHATIRRSEDGKLYLDAAGPVFVNQRAETTVRLALGQRITIGPYDFVVEALQDGSAHAVAHLTLAFALRDTAAAQASKDLARSAVGLRDSWVTRRRLAWFASLLVLVLCAALPAWHAYHPRAAQGSAAEPPVAGVPAQWAAWVLARTTRLDTFWNPGPISSAHQNFAQDCRSCHAKPFERVADASCTHCHKNVGAHVADKTIDQSTFQGRRCANCHKDHQGPTSMRVVDAVGCVQCHSSIRSFSPKTLLGNVSDFARDHPTFRLSIRQSGAQPVLLRVAQTPALKETTALKFPHDLHLAKAGIKSPTGPASSGGRVVLECAGCHTLDATAARFEPVRMEKHCQGCHRLSVDPQAPERQVPHGTPEVVRTAVREIYASLAVDRFPANLVTVNTLLQRPAAPEVASRSTSAARWVQEQSAKTLSAMFDKPTGECKTCHGISRAADGAGKQPNWSVAPVGATSLWLPQSRFLHTQHQRADCASCHQAGRSKAATDILVPDIKVCQSCHTGAKPDGDKVVSRCESCHGFHVKTPHPAFGKSAAAGKP